AGDISHAAGNEGSQIEVTATFDMYKDYNVGEVVTYEGKRYINLIGYPSNGASPVESASWEWRLIEEGVKEWNPNRIYDIGEVAYYKGDLYEAQCITTGEKDETMVYDWEKIESGILEWHKEKSYYIDDIVTYNGKQYKAQCYNISGTPGENPQWEPLN
ncbi:hypothetical protein CN553_18210, partial [Bacillus cereus]